MSSSKPPIFYRPYLRDENANDSASIASSRSSISWRTHRTSTAPSEILSFTRGVLGSLTGRALNRVGEIAMAPIENFLLRRELERLREYLDGIEHATEWEKIKAMLEDSKAADRIFEPLRPMYPQDIRLLAHEIIHIMMLRGRLTLSTLTPRLHFGTFNEYDKCISEHCAFLLALYPKDVVIEVFPDCGGSSAFLANIMSCLSSSLELQNVALPPLEFSQAARTIVRLSVARGMLEPNAFNRETTVLASARGRRLRRRTPNNISRFTQFIEACKKSGSRSDEVVSATTVHLIELHYLYQLTHVADHISTITAIYDLGVHYYNRGFLSEAEKMFDRALSTILETSIEIKGVSTKPKKCVIGY